jgi:inosose dehydratase
MRLGYHTITWGGVVGHPVGVTSVKDLLYLANGSTEDALREIAATGYEGVELFDGNLVQAAEGGRLRSLLDETGLTLVGVYSGGNFIFNEILGEELWRVERAAAVAAEHGAAHLVVGGGAQSVRGVREDDYTVLAKSLDRVVEIAERHGLVASFHPHLTTIVESPEQIEKVLSRSRINFCPDTAHLAAAGGDPAALIRSYPDRIKCVHLKDYRPDPFAFLPLGEGTLDLEDVVHALSDIGYDGWLTVELDEYAGPPQQAAEISRQFLEPLLDRLAAHKSVA